MAVFGRNTARQRLRRAVQESLSIPAFAPPPHHRAEHLDQAPPEAGPPAQQISSAHANDDQPSAQTAVNDSPHTTHTPARAELERPRVWVPTDVSDSQPHTAATLASAQAGIERIRAHAAAEIATSREQTNRALAELDRARYELNDAPTPFASPQLLAMPIPPAALAAHTGRIEEALQSVRRLGSLLELSAANQSGQHNLDAELAGSLLTTVQQHAATLSDDLHTLCSMHPSPPHADAATSYATAAAHAYCALLQRVADATQQLAHRDASTDGGVVEMINQMLAEHPWRHQ